MPAALQDKERLIDAIIKNVTTVAEIHAATAAADARRKETLEVEADVGRWVAVGQAAATKLFELVKDKQYEPDALRSVGDLLTKMSIPHERLQWSEEDQDFY